MKIKKQKKNDVLKKGWGIRTKITWSIVPFVIVVIVTVLSITYSTSVNIVKENSKNLLKEMANRGASEIEGWSNEVLASLENVNITLENLELSDSQLQNYLKSTSGLNKNIPDGVYIGNSKDSLISATGNGENVIANRANEDWYQEGMNHQNFAFGKVYLNDNGEYMITASKVLNGNGTEKQVVAADVNFSEVINLVSNLDSLDTENVFLLDKTTNTIVAHKNKDLLFQSIVNIDDPILQHISTLLNNESDEVISFTNNDNKYYVNIKPVDNTDWLLISEINEEQILGTLTDFRDLTSVMLLVVMVVIFIVVEGILKYQLKPIKNITKDIERISHGDFTVEVKIKSNDEVAVMGKEMNELIKKMRDIFGNIIDISDQLSNQAINSSEISNNLYQVSEIQGSSMKELDVTVDELVRSVNEIADNATELAGIVTETNHRGEVVSSKMLETVKTSKKGQDDMEKARQDIQQIMDSIKVLEESVRDVGQATIQITRFVDVIGEISSQTNLLSLNAAIEAARAGEQGKGFAVVADEIRKLAELSASEVEKIAEINQNITNLVEEVVERTEESSNTIQVSSESIGAASITFNNIFETVNTTNEIVQEMINSIKTVDEVASNVAAITEEQSASSEEILANTESITDDANKVIEASKQVSNDSEILAKKAEELSSHMKQFIIE